MKSFSSLTKGELLTLQIVNDLTIGTDVSKKIDLKITSNKSVIDLRIAISKKIKASWDSIKITRTSIFINKKELGDEDNGKMLKDLRIRTGETLTVSKRKT